jgi:uncharacterized membrane protein
MSTTTASVDVNRPINMVYNQWTQFESFPEFMEGVERIDQRDDTHLHWVIKVGVVTREFDATVTEQHPDERVAWKSDSGPDHAGVVTFHRLDDDNTRVTTQMDVDPDGVIENVADKLGILKARVSGDLKRFKSSSKVGQQKPEGGAATSRAPTPDGIKSLYAAVGPLNGMAPPRLGTRNRWRPTVLHAPEGSS